MTLDELRALAEPVSAGTHLFPPPYRLMAPSLEECEILHALVTATKPQEVLELGTGFGVSARFIAEALRAAGSGRLWTVESKAALADAALPLLDPVLDIVELESVEPEGIEPSLVLIDSGYERRKADIERWLGPAARLQPKLPLVVLHDAERGYDLHGARGVLLSTTSGLWIGRAA